MNPRMVKFADKPRSHERGYVAAFVRRWIPGRFRVTSESCEITRLSIVTVCCLLLSNGCSKIKGSHHDHAEHSRNHSVNWEFHEGRGVSLSAEGKAIIGIELVDVDVAELDNAAIPASALLTTVRGDFVYVVNGNHFFRLPVMSGRKSGDSVEIRDGLFEGDIVVSRGIKQLWLIELQAINGGEACTDGH